MKREVRFTRVYQDIPHVCPECKQDFSGPKLRQYCSDVCKAKAAWRRNGGKFNEVRREARRGNKQ